ncbi:uncharacterized protein A4U43_C01F13870 [Asparagus officinalis]|uniref:MADF domain-containing protein n=1 Tax=Asparagus officinalis TaxID=4686 RepID=A0A5P1FPE0_ASPOF|nr:uncharacterized protein A4U43_C01F13870 [Asparagus officinalis]
MRRPTIIRPRILNARTSATLPRTRLPHMLSRAPIPCRPPPSPLSIIYPPSPAIKTKNSIKTKIRVRVRNSEQFDGVEITPPSRPPNPPRFPTVKIAGSEGETSVSSTPGAIATSSSTAESPSKTMAGGRRPVNSRPCDARRPPRTDVQCKNRIDTLKKKYKSRSPKIADGALAAQWIFYNRLDSLIDPRSPPRRRRRRRWRCRRWQLIARGLRCRRRSLFVRTR